MAYLADFTQRLIDGLSNEGLTCCREYQSTEINTYESRLFATAAPEQIRFYAPIVTQQGTAFPLTLQMRVRFYALPEHSTAALETLCDTYLIPALNKAGMQLRGLTADAPAFEKEIGRMCMTTHITIEAVATHSPHHSETESDTQTGEVTQDGI